MKNNQPYLQKVQEVFKEKFSTTPSLFFSPGRINLIGEHVDYNDGYVLPAAIDKGVYYAIAKNGTEQIHFYSIDFNESYSTTLTALSKQGGWKDYVLSVVNEFVLLDKKIQGFDCVFCGDIPRGSGMSSSAAVEGGLAFALNQIFEYGLSRTQLALLCQRAEHNFPGVKCGIMDQFANMMGKANQVVLLDCQSLSHEYFPLQLKGYKLVLLNSKVHHSLAAGEYNVRRNQCEEGLKILETQYPSHSFRDITRWQELIPFESKMSKEVFSRCLYVVQEIQRTKQAVALLQQNDIEGFGQLMFQTHHGLSKLYNVSCAELDFLVEQAANSDAVIGARLMGGGFGGCTINIVKENQAEQFINNTSQQYHKQFGILPEAYLVQTADGVQAI